MWKFTRILFVSESVFNHKKWRKKYAKVLNNKFSRWPTTAILKKHVCTGGLACFFYGDKYDFKDIYQISRNHSNWNLFAENPSLSPLHLPFLASLAFYPHIFWMLWTLFESAMQKQEFHPIRSTQLNKKLKKLPVLPHMTILQTEILKF